MPRIRLPDSGEIAKILEGVNKRSEMAERKLKSAVQNALNSIDPALKTKVLHDSGVAEADVRTADRTRLDANGVETLTKLIAKLQELDTTGLSMYPGTGEDTRSMTRAESEKMRALATEVSALMRKIAAGVHDANVAAVFGEEHVETARGTFKGAADALDRLIETKDGIMVDCLARSDVWSCGRLTSSATITLRKGLWPALATTAPAATRS